MKNGSLLSAETKRNYNCKKTNINPKFRYYKAKEVKYCHIIA